VTVSHSISDIPRNLGGKALFAPQRQFRLPIPVLLYLIALVTPVTFSIGSLQMTGIRLFLLVLIIPLVINLLRGKYNGIYWTDILFFLHLGWIGVALSKNSPEMLVTQIGSLGIEFLGGYLIGRAYIRNKEDFAGLLRMFILLVCFSFPFAFFETLTGKPLIIQAIQQIPGLNSYYNADLDKRMGLERVQVFFLHPIHYGMFVSISFSLIFVGLNGTISNTRRYIYTLIIGLCVIFSLSSGALLSLILQSILILWATVFYRVKLRWLLLLLTCTFLYLLVDILSNRSPIRVFMHYATFSAHNAYWRGIIFEWGMKNVWANPIFGLGLNDWVRPHYMYSGSMDNFWLVNAVRYGIPGFILLASGYVIALWKIGRRNFDEDQTLWQLRRAWLIGFVGLTFTLCTVHVWANVYSFVFFVFGSGMWFLAAECSDGSATPENNIGAQSVELRTPQILGQKDIPYSRFSSKRGRN